MPRAASSARRREAQRLFEAIVAPEDLLPDGKCGRAEDTEPPGIIRRLAHETFAFRTVCPADDRGRRSVEGEEDALDMIPDPGRPPADEPLVESRTRIGVAPVFLCGDQAHAQRQ